MIYFEHHTATLPYIIMIKFETTMWLTVCKISITRHGSLCSKYLVLEQFNVGSIKKELLSLL